MGLPDALSGSTGFLLAKAAQRGVDLAEAALSPLGLKARHYGVLATLEAQQPASQHQLGQALRIDRTTMVAIVDYLEARGLVERGLHPADRRAHHVRLTSAGASAMQQARGAMVCADTQLVASLTADEHAQLVRLLYRVAGIAAP